jgi:peptidoglycan/LPS O-acetylase OafA/YrhL
LFIYLFTVFLFLPTILRYEINYLGNDNGWVIYFSPYTRIFEFVSGVLVAMVFKTSAPRDTKYLVDMCLVLIFSLLVYILFYPVVTNTEYDLLRTNFFFAPIICLILFLLTCYNSRISKILGNNIFSFFGEISYSTYLMSFPVISLLNASFVVVNLSIVGYISGICKVIACFILTTLMAYGSYLLIEKPSRKLLR